MEAKLYKSDGAVLDVVPANGKFFTLEETQKLVGGYVEYIGLGHKTTMVVDEEGKLNQKPINTKANEIFREAFALRNDYIVGDVLVCPSSMLR